MLTEQGETIIFSIGDFANEELKKIRQEIDYNIDELNGLMKKI